MESTAFWKLHFCFTDMCTLLNKPSWFSTACTMYKSFIEKKPVGMDAKSIASGLAPPFAGMKSTLNETLWQCSLL